MYKYLVFNNHKHRTKVLKLLVSYGYNIDSCYIDYLHNDSLIITFDQYEAMGSHEMRVLHRLVSHESYVQSNFKSMVKKIRKDNRRYELL